jgi:hypothetical protein
VLFVGIDNQMRKTTFLHRQQDITQPCFMVSSERTG